MKPKQSVIATAIAVSGLTLTLNAFAAPASFLPPTHTQGEVIYLTGGIGVNEANAVKHVAKSYPLELEFALKAKPKDEYLANVNVQIKDAHYKTILNAASVGPYLLANLPVGKYWVSAAHDGKIERHRIEIAAKEHQRIAFEWKS